jgi:lysophospholipase L1-like esterase
MTRTTKLFAAAALGVILGASACKDDLLFRPANFVPIDPLFERYVSFGNSITAGFQSAGINDSTQVQAYPVLLANRMGSPFFVPYMNRPGCPPPYTNVYAQSRVGSKPGTWCGDTLTGAPRRSQVPPPFISNVAVPGATSLSPTDNQSPFSNSNALTTLFLGGLTQVQAGARAKPTFVTVWIGNNDVLGSILDTANAGNPALVTDTAVFRQRYQALLDSIDVIGPRGGVLIGVANVTLVPFLTRGSKFFNVKFAGDAIAGADSANRRFPANFLVAPNCAGPHGDSVFVPFQRGAAVLAFVRNDTLVTAGVDCDDVHNVSPTEFASLVATVARYNSIISAEATARGYAYVDPNALFAALPAGAIPTFPNVPSRRGGPVFAAAGLTPFGTIFSLDGIHPTGAAHKLVANALIPAINAKYGTAIRPIP